jgi:tetratricopeptide (TPR) repeat protein
MAGTQAEFQRRLDEARDLFREAWDAAQDDYDSAMAAHYIAHLAREAAEAHRWNLIALEHGRRDQRAEEFMGSLLVNLGGTYEALGDTAEAERCFEFAEERGVQHFRG